MRDSIHQLAPHHLPYFLPGADGSDQMFTTAVIFLIAAVMGIGILYFSIHALPEKLAHGSNSMQTQAIGVLALLALFTHNNVFWVIALLLATIRFPDLATPLNSISKSLESLKERMK